MRDLRRSRRLRQSFSTLSAAAFLIVTASAFISDAGSGPALVAGANGALLVRVNPAAPVVTQYCPSAAKSAPGVSPGVEPASLDPALFTMRSPLQIEASGSSIAEVRLRFDARAYDILKSKARVTMLNFILDNTKSVRLDLHRVESYDDQTVFVAGGSNGDESIPPPDVILMAGSVQGIPGSAAFLGLSRTSISGYVIVGDSTYFLSSGPPRTDFSGSPQCVIANLRSVESTGMNSGFCRFDEMPQDRLTAAATSAAKALGELEGLRVCNMAIECDYQYFLMMGADESAALNYVAVLLAAVSSICERDVSVALRLSYVRVWTTEDPYQSCGWDSVAAFQRKFRPTGPRPHAAFKFSGCGGAGIATGSLTCPAGDTGLLPAAAARIQGFFPYPITPSENNWDVYVVAHEIGHLFGSPHTNCYNPPLDSCRNVDEFCYSGPVICGRQTIMSYCSQCGGLSNFDMVFPPPVALLMEKFIVGACMDVTSGWFYVCNDDSRTFRVDSITTADQWMSVSRSTFLVAQGDSQRVAIYADWNQFPTPQQTGLLSMFCDGAPSPLLIPVTARRVLLLAAFSVSSLSGCAPLTVQFADQSAGQPTAWLWHFGDGDSSTAQNPSHDYTEPGTYTARMEASNSCYTSVAEDQAVITVTGLTCNFGSPIIVNRGDSLIRSYDLWSSAGGMTGGPDSLEFEIAAVSRDSCGARIDDNRYLSISPVRGWAGTSHVTIRTTDQRGCSCVVTIDVIINVPPWIELQSPAGTRITNRGFLITWRAEDPDDDAWIVLYRCEKPDCGDGIPINGKPLSENQTGNPGAFGWSATGVPDGRYYIKAVIADQTASSEDCSRGLIVADRTSPATTISTRCDEPGSSGWCRSDGVVTLTAVDNLTGVSKTLYRVNRGGWTQYRKPFKVDAQGATTVEYFSIDVAGNTETIQAAVQPFKIDTKSPFISKLEVENSRFVDGDHLSATPAFSFQLLDEGSGLDLSAFGVTIEPGTAQGPVVINANSAEFSYDTATFAVRVTILSPLAPVRQTLTVAATDRLGNTTSVTANFQVGEALRVEDVISYPNPTRGPAQFTFNLTQEATVTVRIYDLSGNLVRRMIRIPCKAGYNALPWDGLTDGNAPLAAGAYLYEVTAANGQGTARQIEKLAILR